jgi:glutamate 5-kinase
MYVYDKLFSEYNHTVAQILITASDVKHDDRYSNFINTLNRLLELETIPIINENDTIATEEIVIGDNDTLAAIVATSVKADLLVLLSDIDGLYSADPHQDRNATLISEVHNLDEQILATAGGSGSPLGTGGMKTKLTAARMCMESGCDMVIMNGSDPDLLYRIADGEQIGTRFYAGKQVER